MNTQNIPELQRLLNALPAAQAEAAKALTLVSTLELRNGQDCICCTVGGLALPLTTLGRDYMPKVVPGRQALIAELAKQAREHLLACRSKVEGIHFRIRELSK